MIRLLATPPAAYQLGQLQTEAGALACNIVGDQIAGYWPDGQAPTQAEWDAIVAANVPTPDPTSSSPEVIAAQAIQAEIDARLAPTDVNSIAEMKAAIRDGLAAAVANLGGS
jgi:hypothetical protein